MTRIQYVSRFYIVCLIVYVLDYRSINTLYYYKSLKKKVKGIRSACQLKEKA